MLIDFDPKCYKCVSEFDKNKQFYSAAALLFKKIKKQLLLTNSGNNKVHLCKRHISN